MDAVYCLHGAYAEVFEFGSRRTLVGYEGQIGLIGYDLPKELPLAFFVYTKKGVRMLWEVKLSYTLVR